ERFAGPLVFAALRADAERSAAVRFLAADRACLASAVCDAAACGSRFSALRVALERVRETLFLGCWPASTSCSAFSRVSCDAVPFLGGASWTPARRAFERPIAIACLVERAPCLPSRMCSISSWTNSPACVLGALPSRLSFFARSTVSFSGMLISPPFDNGIASTMPQKKRLRIRSKRQRIGHGGFPDLRVVPRAQLFEELADDGKAAVGEVGGVLPELGERAGAPALVD